MAIRLTLEKTDRILFCGSKWWGDPDMPEGMTYPVMTVMEEGETLEYPLTFICQINCEDIADLDKEGLLPHEGMLYFFAAIDQWLGYDSPGTRGMGEWPKGEFVVKYVKTINFETFQSCMLVDDDDNPLTEPELGIRFSECGNADEGIKIGGIPAYRETGEDRVSLLQLDSDVSIGLQLDGHIINLLLKDTDLKFGNWKRARGYMTKKG